ncbi:MAG: GGDEF domain-containing protein [Oceanospirillales bacterium]|nr:MAG: GGDEF domain-containing protein [Oceanospirillales bacterium]
MSDENNWRNKYRDVARELEVCEKSRNLLLEQVHDFAVQLSLATNGQNPQLDRLMSDLTNDLSNGELKRVSKYLTQIEKQIRGLDALRVKTSQQIMQQLRVWLKELQAQDSQRQFLDAFDNVSEQMTEHAESTHALPEMIAQLLDIQKRIQNQTSQNESDDLADHDDLANARLASGLLELIQRLSVPAEYIPRASALIQRLERSHSTDDLDECLKEATELARLSGSGTDSDIQAYLSGLNEQLAFLREFFDTQEEVEKQQLQRNNLLDQTVRADVQVIHHKVQQSQDIDELKKAVNVQLVSIIKAMNHHKVSEQKRIESLQAEKKALMERLDSMEQQSIQLRQSAEDAHVKSRTDPLTGLPNRLAYDQRFNEELARFNRYGTVFSLCVADIDYFKRINDDYGHLAGDKVLRLMARILKNQLRNVDFIARFGGEEFVILMPSTDADAARVAAEKVRQTIETSPFNFQSNPVKITMSFGITQVEEEDSVSSMFARADKAMYTAKQEGRNRVNTE